MSTSATRVAALYDIHGNLPALKAILRDVHLAGVDQIVVDCDVVPGPMPRETLDALMNLDVTVQFLYSNEQLLASWPPSIRLHIDGHGEVLFCHGTPRSEVECFTRITPEHLLRPVFDRLDVDTVVCGHTHMQFDRTIRNTRVVNAGSVGMPFQQPCGAYWLLLGPGVELRRSDYNYGQAAEAVRATGYPDTASAARYILEPPCEQERAEAMANLSFR